MPLSLIGASTPKTLNPWIDLPSEPPFVLPCDASLVAEFNSRARPEYKLHLDVLPEPFLGNPQAPVLLLGLNPGYDEADLATHRDLGFVAANRQNLVHEHCEYPFYLLNPRLPCLGQDWWRRHLGTLIDKVDDLCVVASSIFVVEFHGYHSRKFGHGRLRLPSQEYTRSLVVEALNRDAVIIIQRGQRVWHELISELANSSTVFAVLNVQNPVISEGNCPEGFAHVLAAIKGVA